MSETTAIYTTRQQQRAWTPDELDTLRTRYTTDGPTRLGVLFQRAPGVVRDKAKALGVQQARGQSVQRLHAAPAPPGSFGAVLGRWRLRANLSRWELARTAGINHSYVTRLESGDRSYPSRQITAALACGLRLSAQEADQFMALAGYLPPSLQKLGGDDTTIAALVAALTDDTLPPEDRANLRAIVEVVCSKWTKGRDK